MSRKRNKCRFSILSVQTARVCIVLPVIVIIFIIIFICFFPSKCCCVYKWDIAGYLTVIVAIANAILLYRTLKEQINNNRRQEKKYKNDKFETIFFNLLDYHNRIKDNLCIIIPFLTDNFQQYYVKGVGLKAFDYAQIQLELIKNCFCQETYLGKFDQYDADLSIYAINDDFERRVPSGLDTDAEMRRKEHEEWKRQLLKLIISHYNITERTWDVSHLSDNIDKTSFDVFHNKYRICFDQYIRSLKVLLKHTTRRSEKEYSKIVSSQMSRNEGHIVKLFVEYSDKDLKTLVDKINN